MLPVLPVTEALPALLDTLERRPNAVLVAPPGAGKTTIVPLALLDAAWRGDGAHPGAGASPPRHPRRRHAHGLADR